MAHIQMLSAPPCVMCLKEATKQCSGCHAFWYCSKECQRKHWKAHKVDCGRVKELQDVAPKRLLEELEEREREFCKAQEIVRKHRETASCKTVWVTRAGELLGEDLEDARQLPGIKDRLDACDANPSQNQQASLNTLFSAAEGVSKAKSKAYFDGIQGVKEQLRELSRKDQEMGTTTVVQCGGQRGIVLPSTEAGEEETDQQLVETGQQELRIDSMSALAEAAATAAASAQAQVAMGEGQEESEVGLQPQGSQQAVEAMRARMQAVLGPQAPALPVGRG